MDTLMRGFDPDLQTLLTELSHAGVQLSLQAGGQLGVSAPAHAVPAGLLQRLRERKADLLAWLHRMEAAQAGMRLPQIVPDPQRHAEPFGLADLQVAFAMGDSEAMEFHVRPHYYLEIEWPGLDPQRYEEALDRALRRQQHNLLVLTQDMRLRAIGRYEPLRLQVHDLRGLPTGAQQEALLARRAELSRRTLPLDRWPWMDCQVSLYDDCGARLHWNNNNFFSDGYGSFRLMDDAKRFYDDPALASPPLQLGFRDCVLALQRAETSALGERSRDYWLQRLPQLPGPPPLPLVPGFDRQRRSWLQRRDAVLPAARWSAFQRSARRHGLTPTNALFAAYAEVVARWSGSRHFLLNNMVTHRQPLHPQINEVLGNFASLYPLEVDWREAAPFAARARTLQQRIVQDLQHTHWSGVKVLQALNRLRKTPGQAPCPFVVGSGLFMAPMSSPHAGCLETPQVLLDHQFWALEDGGLWTVWDVIEEAFPAGLIDAMWQAYRGLLDRLCGDEAAWSCEGFDLLPPDQRAGRRRANDTARPLPAGLLHQGLARSARRWPGRTAVIDAQRRMSYVQLHCHANRLAHALRDAGVGRGDRVAVLLDKGWQQVVAVHGILGAGAAYVPLSPDWPAARIAALLAGVGAVHVVTREALPGGLALPAGVRAWRVDDSELDRWPGTAPEPVSAPDDPAYILFTSGSTGVPKGVVIDHRGALNTVADINQRFGVTEHDVVFGLSSLCFDLSVYDLFGTLLAGGTLVLPAAAEVLEPVAWLRALLEHGVTLWNSVPALMQLMLEAAQAQDITLPQLHTVLLSGDWIPLTLPPRIHRCAPQAQVVSLGGATEASIWSIVHRIGHVDPRWASIPYGRPLANQRWHVLHDDGHDAPDWVPGQLHIAGDGLALGYWGDDARTAAAFAAHPRTGERLYRTGDLGRYLPDGSIEFLGRADFQLKVQGLRIEPGEVEQALLAHPHVESAVVLAGGREAGRRLLAFVVGRRPHALDAEALLAFARGLLPAYMVPACIVPLEALPLTGTGKLDRQALQRLADGHGEARPAPVAPRTPVEQALAAIWQEVLALPAVGVHDDFFELGGQSFAAVRMMTRIAARFGRHLSLGSLLEARTIARLAERLGGAQHASPRVMLWDAGEGTPCFLVHPAGGGVLCYRALAERMDRPVHGLQAPGLHGGPQPDELPALAALYVDAVQEAQPAGPYLLGGWSSGGVIAYEMARQLEAQGHTVAQLVVIDAPAPMPHDTAPPASRCIPDAPAHEPEALQPMQQVFAAIVEAVRRYRPPAQRIRAGITVLRAAEGTLPEWAGHPAAHSADWGWAGFTSGRVRALEMPGNHDTMLAAPHDAALARAVASAFLHTDHDTHLEIR